jgi:hypothetical protein
MVKGVQSSLIRHAWEQHHHLNSYGKNRRSAIVKVMSLQKEGARWIPARYHSALVLENVPLGSDSEATTSAHQNGQNQAVRRHCCR